MRMWTCGLKGEDFCFAAPPPRAVVVFSGFADLFLATGRPSLHVVEPVVIRLIDACPRHPAGCFALILGRVEEGEGVAPRLAEVVAAQPEGRTAAGLERPVLFQPVRAAGALADGV